MTDNLKKGKRLTLVMALDVEKALRKLQADKIRKSEGSISFSYVVNQQLRKALKL